MEKSLYQVYAPDGRLVMQSTEDCRYNKDIEEQMLENGYTIKLGGKKLTKKQAMDR